MYSYDDLSKRANGYLDILDSFLKKAKKQFKEFDIDGAFETLKQLDSISVSNEQIVSCLKGVERLKNFLSGCIIADVNVSINQKRSLQEVLDATGRKQFTDELAMNTAPAGGGDGDVKDVKIMFFKPCLRDYSEGVSFRELEEEFNVRGVKPVDPITLATFNEANPDFFGNGENMTFWKVGDDRWCYACFCINVASDRAVYIQDGYYKGDVKIWSKDKLFAGVRKN